MENYSYPPAYPESGESSPRSREIDFENTPSWEEPATANYKVKFMCSYGGKIHPRPHDNQLSYNGGETKILAVDRNIKFAVLIVKLLALYDATDVSFKYQLPGEDLDALISVTNDEDLEHMMHEYDRLCKASPKPARLRLFLFPAAAGRGGGGSFGSSEVKSDRERFVDALNSGPIQSTPTEPRALPTNNVDFLFGFDKGISPPLPQVAIKVQDPISDPEIPVPTPEDRVIKPGPIQNQIQDLQRLQISGQGQGMYRKRSDDNLVGAFPGDYYAQKVPQPTLQATIQPAYWPENQQIGGFYQSTVPFPEQQGYMIPTPTGMYHAPMGRPMACPVGQGYYAVQRMPTEVYRDNQSSLYSVVQPPSALSPTTPPPQTPPKSAGFPTSVGVGGMVDGGYTQGAYDSVTGRQVYYTAQGGVMPPQTYQAIPAAAVSADMRSTAALNQEGKVVVKTSQTAG